MIIETYFRSIVRFVIISEKEQDVLGIYKLNWTGLANKILAERRE